MPEAPERGCSRSTARTLAVCLIALWPATSSGAEDAPAVGTVLLDVRPQAGVPGWIAEAAELNIHSEISNYQRVTVVQIEAAPEKTCGTDRRCQLDVYRKAGVDIVFFATVTRENLHYEIYETWTRVRVNDGSFAIGAESSLIGLKQRTLRAFHPVLTQGGILDQKQYLEQRQSILGAGSDHTRSLSSHQRLLLASLLAAWSLFFALPFLLAGFGLCSRRLRRLARLRTARGAVILVLGAAALAAAVWMRRASGAPLLPPLVVAELTALDWLFGLFGGMAGGWFLLDNLRVVFPPFAGFDRVSHNDVSRLIWSWCVSSFFRLLLLVAYYLPFVFLLVFVHRAFSLTHYFTIILLAPLTGLAARFWFATWVDCLALYLDDHVISGPAGRENPWHREIHQYFMGYVRRTGQDIEPRLLSRILFLPGSLDGVYTYGGGRTHYRIVIGTSLLELAMGALDDEDQAEEKAAVTMPDWSGGVVLPNTRARDAGSALGSLRRLLGAPETTDSEAALQRRKKAPVQRKPLGQAATLLGVVVPAQAGELVPLISDNDGDLAVVRELLSEHYAWYAPDPDDEDDDSDPNDRDFLFGALTREFGIIERRDSQLSTLAMAATERAMSRGGIFRKLHTWSSALARRLFLRHPTIIADSYAALNHARHHLFQHLCYLHTRKPDFFTARADLTKLSNLSARLLREVRSTQAAAGEAQLFRASFRNRLLWLSRFFDEPIEVKNEKLVRRLTLAGVLIAALVGLGFAVRRSVDYHPIYVERIAEQERAIAEKAQHDEDQDKGQPSDGQERQ